MSVKYPYRAIICGEEHIVNGWRGENLLTDKGQFIFRRLQGEQVDSEWQGEVNRMPAMIPIQTQTLLEVARIRSDEHGGWLLNGRALSPLQNLPAGFRLNALANSEVLRVYKGEINAVVWVRAISTGNTALQLDTVLADWKRALLYCQAYQTSAPSEISSLNVLMSGLNLFAGWSKPIWLTGFHQVGSVKNVRTDEISDTIESVESDSTSGGIRVPTEPVKTRQRKPAAQVKNPEHLGEEYFTIKGAATYADKSERTIRNWIINNWLKVEKNATGRKIRIAKSELDKCIKRQ